MARSAPEDVDGLFDAGLLDGGPHRTAARPTRGDPVPQAADPSHLCALRHHRPAVARRLPRAWRVPRARTGAGAGPAAIIEEVTKSGLRGRGGAGFPTGIKWRTTADAQAAQKYIVCNADEGDSGTYADRMIMEGDPFVLIEGMAIAGIAVGATKGYVYIRSEYPHAIETFGRGDRDRARRRAARQPASLGSAYDFDHRDPGRRRRLCLRRGDRAARQPRRQARSGPRQAAAAGASRACSASRPSSTT